MNELISLYENMGIQPAVYQYGETVIARLKAVSYTHLTLPTMAVV